MRHPKLARRHLALEGHRALACNAYLLPRAAPDGNDPHIRGQIFRSATSVPVLFDPA